MGILVDYFAATAEEAHSLDIRQSPLDSPRQKRRLFGGGKGGGDAVAARFDGFHGLNGEPIFPLATLEELITGRPRAEAVDEIVGRTIGDGEGPWLVSVNKGLFDALANRAGADWSDTARAWAATEELAIFGDLTEELTRLLGDLSSLANRARSNSRNLYAWVSL